jgi:outer membrane immunogenic protein
VPRYHAEIFSLGGGGFDQFCCQNTHRSVGVGVISGDRCHLPVKAAPMPAGVNWSGFYVGAHFGYLWGRTTFIDNGVLAQSDAPTDGVVGGGLAGYSWQSGPYVLGIEGDIGRSNAHGNGNDDGAGGGGAGELHWTAHVRGRAGYAWGQWLLFVAGGLAIADFDVSMQDIISMTCGGIYTGFSVGGGIDYAINNRVSARLEYLYDDFGRKTYVMSSEVYEVRLTGSTLRAAINFKLGPN